MNCCSFVPRLNSTVFSVVRLESASLQGSPDITLQWSPDIPWNSLDAVIHGSSPLLHFTEAILKNWGSNINGDRLCLRLNYGHQVLAISSIAQLSFKPNITHSQLFLACGPGLCLDECKRVARICQSQITLMLKVVYNLAKLRRVALLQGCDAVSRTASALDKSTATIR